MPCLLTTRPRHPQLQPQLVNQFCHRRNLVPFCQPVGVEPLTGGSTFPVGQRPLEGSRFPNVSSRSEVPSLFGCGERWLPFARSRLDPLRWPNWPALDCCFGRSIERGLRQWTKRVTPRANSSCVRQRCLTRHRLIVVEKMSGFLSEFALFASFFVVQTSF